MTKTVGWVLVGFWLVVIIAIGGWWFTKDNSIGGRPSTNTQTNNNANGPDYQPNQTPTPAPTPTPSVVTYTKAQIASHNSSASCWLLIGGSVYDVTQFLGMHPGGGGRILPYCGREATQAFQTRGGEGQHSSTADALLREYFIGKLG